MSQPPTPAPAGSVLTDAQITAAVPLLDAGASLRQIATALGCSRHQARLLVQGNNGEQPKPRVKPTIETQSAPIFTAVPPLPTGPLVLAQPRTGHEQPSPPLFSDLKKTREELKAQLDLAARTGNRQAVSAFSLALARLEGTSDPTDAASLDERAPRLDMLPDAALELVDLAIKAITPTEDQGTQLNEVERLTLAYYFAGLDVLRARLQAAIRPGDTIVLTFVAPEALVLQKAKRELERHIKQGAA